MKTNIVSPLNELLSEISLLEYSLDNKAKLDSAKTRLGMLIRKAFNEHSHYLNELKIIRFTPISTGTPSSVTLKTKVFNRGLEKLKSLVKLVIEDIELDLPTNTDSGKMQKSNGEQKDVIDLNSVFIVHGHDELAKTEVALFIERLGFKPIILHEQISGGKTIIEKIEAHSNVGFGIVLYTPCDLGAVKGQENSLLPRARQNVVFEHGYLIGRLGRQNVCALVKEQVELPNDMSGIVYTLMDIHKGWHMKVAKEMKARRLCCRYE